MRIACIGDIVGRPGRNLLKAKLADIRKHQALDLVIANYENASHGFGLSKKNAKELLASGIDIMTGGNHSFDKADIKALLEEEPILRPLNYPDMVPGRGVMVVEVAGVKVAVLNVMGHFSMPYVDNFFRSSEAAVKRLKEEGVKHIIMDVHAEASSEKRALFLYLKEHISLLYGTHTHIGSDDAQIIRGSGYVSDIGLTGCRDNVIGMQADVPIERFKSGLSGRFEVPNSCKAWIQMLVCELDDAGRCVSLEKLRYFDDGRILKSEAYID